MTDPDDLPATPGTLAFIGGGNMARSLIAGLLGDGIAPTSIRVAEPVADVREALHRDFDVPVFADNGDAVADAGTWLLAAKPQVMPVICAALSSAAQAASPLVVSIAAGITTAQLERWLGGGLPIVRAMPNTPALLGAGVTGLFANAQVDADGRAGAERLLASAGPVVWLDDESMLDAVTAVSGSGPAYVFLLAEAMLDAARAQGLPEAAARTLVLRTILGAARMLVEEDATPAELRARVTSRGGTTEAAIEVFERGRLRALVGDAVDAASRRSRELSLQLEQAPCA
jgi:pyrroline-5-carboxylate reductase